jgi:hypothetical protein
MRKLSDADMIFELGLFYDEAPVQSAPAPPLVPKPPSDRNASVEFMFGPHRIVVDPSFSLEQGFQSVSNRIWRGSLLMASLMHSLPISVVGKDVLELGCGRGLVGLCCAAFGAATSVLTDCDDRPLSVLLRQESSVIRVRFFFFFLFFFFFVFFLFFKTKKGSTFCLGI